MKRDRAANWWDHDRVQELKDAWAAGQTATEIAETLKTTRHAVLAKVDRLRRAGGIDAPARRDGESSRAITSRRVASSPKPPQKRAFDGTWMPRGKPVEVETWVDPPVEIPATAVKVVDVEPYHCRWPLGDPRNSNFVFCGAKKVAGTPYCRDHVKRAYALPEMPSEAPIVTARAPNSLQDGDSYSGGGVGKVEKEEAPERNGARLEMEGVDG